MQFWVFLGKPTILAPVFMEDVLEFFKIEPILTGPISVEPLFEELVSVEIIFIEFLLEFTLKSSLDFVLKLFEY